MNNNIFSLQKDTNSIIQFISDKSWVKNIDSDLSIPGIDWELIIDRSQADKHGIEIQSISGNQFKDFLNNLEKNSQLLKLKEEINLFAEKFEFYEEI